MASIVPIPPLTSLRFFAAALVFVNHAPALVPTNHGAIGAAFGAAGVGFFFVLSGMILAHAYRERLQGTEGLTRYFAGRVARIWPLHLAGLVIFAAMFAQALTPFNIFTFVIDAALLQSYFPAESIYFSWNDVSWSLSAEIFFYAMFPLCLGAVLRMSRRQACGALLAVLASVFVWSIVTAGYDWHYWAVYIFPPVRLADFVCGILLYRIISSVTLIGPSAVIAEGLVLGVVMAIGIAYPLIPEALRLSAVSLPLALAIIGVFFVSRGPIAQLLSLPPLIYLGEISFAFYVVHKIVLRAVGFTAGLSTVAFAFVGCIVLAAFLHHVVELPANALLRRVLSKGMSRRKK